MQQTEKLLPFFVYLIFDPKEKNPFYVGMGQNSRDLDHKPGDKDRKEKKIKEIRERGEKESRVIIGRYNTKEEAFSVEATLIKWVYGFENLTNQIQGRQHIFIRPFSQSENKTFEHMERIDREKNYQIHSGAYTKELINRIDNNQIIQKLEYIKEVLVLRFSNLNISEAKILTAQDPCVLISGFSEHLQIQVRMPPKTGKYFTINYLPSCTKSKKDFEKIINKLFPNIKIPNGNAYGKYFPYKENNKTFRLDVEESNKIIEIIPKLLEHFDF